MYSINKNIESFIILQNNNLPIRHTQDEIKSFNNNSFKCNDINKLTTNTLIVNSNNYLKNKNINCLTTPSKVFDGENKKNFILSIIKNDCTDLNCSKSSDHAFQIYPTNLLSNTIFIDTVKPNFFSIVNTINMKPNGEIKLINDNNKINLIQINDLKNNDSTIMNFDLNGNLCHDPDDINNNFKFNFVKNDKQIKLIKYENNPIIFFFGDYNACSLDKKTLVNNLYIYFDYGNKKNLDICLNKMKFNIIKNGNTTKDLKIPFNMHGSQYNDFISKNFMINFDPRNLSTQDGFITIINTINDINNFKKDDTIAYGSINFDKDLIERLINEKKSCLYINFWLVSFDFLNEKVISINDKKGPFNKIDFIGNPKIIIYIPPYILNDNEFRKSVIKSLYQENKDMCDIYINISY